MHLYVGIDVFFIAASLPSFVKAFLKCDEGTYYIYINSELSIEEKEKAIKHECLHLIQNDMENEEPVAVIEKGVKQWILK